MISIFDFLSACPDGLIVLMLAVLYLVVMFLLQYRQVLGFILVSICSIKVLPFLILLVIVLLNTN